MKKIKIILGISILICMLVFNFNHSDLNKSTISDLSLNSLVELALAQAEVGQEACVLPPIYHNSPGVSYGVQSGYCYDPNTGRRCGHSYICYVVQSNGLRHCQEVICAQP